MGENAIPSIGKSEINGKEGQEEKVVVDFAEADTLARESGREIDPARTPAPRELQVPAAFDAFGDVVKRVLGFRWAFEVQPTRRRM